MSTVPNSPSQLPRVTSIGASDIVAIDQPDGLGGFNSAGAPAQAMAALVAPLIATAIANAITPATFTTLFQAWMATLPTVAGVPGSKTPWNDGGIPCLS